MFPWISYRNGNYIVLLNSVDGTKIRYNSLNFLKPDRVESIDVKVSNRCNHGCEFCHENSHGYGTLAAIQDVAQFANSLPPFTEIALGGGNLMEDINFTVTCLKIFKKARAFCSITIHQEDFIKYNNIIKHWVNKKLVYGVGVSLSNSDDPFLWQYLNEIPNTILHVIAGLLTTEDINKIKEHNAKILILGYKKIRRGYNFYNQEMDCIDSNIKMLHDQLPQLMKYTKVCSFDNLALEQLNVKKYVSEDFWNTYYMGDDGTTTFYVDLVTMQYAKSSTSETRYIITDLDVSKMYQCIVKEK